MKVCKNGFDIILYPIVICSQCAFKRHTSPCLWLKIVGTKSSFNCGGVKTDVLSDIFKI